MESKLTRDQARSQLLALLQEAGREDAGLLQYVQDLEETCSRLEAENKRLKEAAARRASAGTAMNSRLKDALRE